MHINFTKMKNFLFVAFFMAYFTFSFTNCNKGEDEYIPTPTPEDSIKPHEKTNRTILTFLVGDMNLWQYMEESVNQLERGWDNNIDGTLLVYLDNSKHLTQFGQPVLLEITHDESDMIVSKVVKTYEDQDAGDPNIVRNILNDAITLYPANSHGLIIGAHGNGWLPEITENDGTKSLSGPERFGSSLEIDELAKILPVKYDFILFHACNMINIETVYQLRNKCDYVMGSAYSLPGYGYPYELIVPYLYTKPYADLYKASIISGNDYLTNKDPETFDVFTVEVIKTSELENLAAVTSRLLDDLNMNYNEIRGELYKEREELKDAPGMNYVIDYYYQFLLDIKGLYFLSENEPLKQAFQNALDKTIIQHYVVAGADLEQTGQKLNLAFDPQLLNKIGVGLSFYLPYYEDINYWNQLNSIFNANYDWAKASGFDKVR